MLIQVICTCLYSSLIFLDNIPIQKRIVMHYERGREEKV